MKYLILTATLLVAMAFTTKKEDLEKEPGPYNVSYCKPDATLAKGQARVEFKFTMGYGIAVPDSVQLSHNGVLKTVKPDLKGKANFNLSAGKYVFQFFLNSDYSEIYTDSIVIKSGCRTGIDVTFQNSREPTIAEKPVIYVYPDVTKNITITLNVQGNLSYTYPEYKKGWNFIADPDGTIHMNEKEYDYLFWDGSVNLNYDNADLSSGFVVKKDSLTQFFEQKLTAMGLNPREQQDFITYWVPQMQVSESNFIHFMFTQEYDSVASMNVTPKPDHIFRVFMLWNNAADMNTTNLRAQETESFSRDGFTIVEWGGAKIAKSNNQL